MDGNNNRNNNNDLNYYSYGRLPADREREQGQNDSERETFGVEVTPPRELKTYPMQSQAPHHRTPWSYSEQRKSRGSTFKSVVASFLAGALVVGGLMFASDRMNLFSGSDVFASQPAASESAGTGVRTASIDVVRPNTIAELVGIASPAVVKIETYAERSSRSGYPGFFNDFFQIPEQRQPSESQGGNLVQVGSGSGFFFDKAGYILTNEHVINGASEVRVVVEGEKEPYVAKVLGTAYDLDLAVLKIEGSKDFPVLPIGSSENINVGDWVVAIGNPYEFDHTVTVGVLSAKERAINIPDSDGTRKYRTLLQTDASINPGNSGGPLLNLQGEVIGINTAVNAEAQGIGFAIPTSTITDVLESLKANKEIPRPYIGVRMGDVPENYIEDLKLDNGDGAFVTEVLFGSPAHRAGLAVYDVILSVNGEAVKDANALSNIVGGKKPGDKLELEVMRNGEKAVVNVTVGDMNEQNQR